ncbi:hypothetical protein SAMN05421773_10629 [Streptomyces aidingensis]|uniref:Uncharacterized protein n=1 Tax=Streptomyces aidingensis TaxID=910347 RepID=A0A1I1LYX6_9ACTN|nr:hypothetical protein SAMN05421773_10629 [Streptomyces aidingensis]
MFEDFPPAERARLLGLAVRGDAAADAEPSEELSESHPDNPDRPVGSSDSETGGI